MSKYNLIVVGGGSGGIRAARVAASKGAKVALVESSDLGGTCVNLGCVPKKLFSYAAGFSKVPDTAEAYGWTLEVQRFDWKKLLENKNKEIARLNKIYQQMLEKSGIHIFRGHGQFRSPEEIAVVSEQGQQVLNGEHILIATGGAPFLPDIPGKEHAVVSDDLFHLSSLPERLLIYGSGYIAVEFASIYAGLGVEVDLVYRGQHLLKRFEREVSEALASAFKAKGIKLWPGHEITAIQKATDQNQYKVTLSGNGEDKHIHTGLTVMATGRKPNTNGLGLEHAGLSTEANGKILVNDHYQTSVSHIYAVGDVIDRVALTPVALREGTIVANTLFGDPNQNPNIDYQTIPTAVFTHPEIATVGLTEVQANEQGFNVQCFQSHFKPLKYAFLENADRTLLKMIVDQESQRVLGLHMIGNDAAEMMQGFAVAVGMKATKADFDAMIGIHPTSAEEWVTLR